MSTIAFQIIKNLLLGFVCMVLLNGCIYLGPRALPQNRIDFNAAIQRSDSEQILLNLVRMYYTDNPYFLNVNSISSQMEYAAQLHADSAFTKEKGISEELYRLLRTTYLLGSAEAKYSEKPTITYSPLQGESFTRQMLTSISVEEINLLLSSGWNIARILRVVAAGLGNIPNAPSASKPASSQVPDFQKFVTLMHYIRELSLEDDIDLSSGTWEKRASLDIIIKRKQGNAKRINRLFDLLQLDSNTKILHLVQGKHYKKGSNVLPIYSRSLLGVMYFLSKSVQVLPEDIKSGVVVLPVDSKGKPFYWQKVTAGMMNIYICDNKPGNAAVSVHYRNHWYYIANNDLDSKQTLTLLMLLFSLQAGNQKFTPPVLTISV